MIRVYYTYYEKETAEHGKIKELEHRLGRELLCRGLKEIYGLQVLAENRSKGIKSSRGDLDSDDRSGTPAVDSLLAKEENGKPYIKDRPDIHFNISHCSGLVVCAFADKPVGIDAEMVKPVRDPLIRRVLHEQELQVLSRYGEIPEKGKRVSGAEDKNVSGPEDKNVSGTDEKKIRSREFLRLFFRYWTLKESWLKQDGSGLTREPREICFSVDPDDWTSPVRASDPGKICLQKKMVRNQDLPAEYILSVCVPNSSEGPSEGPDMGVDRSFFWTDIRSCPEEEQSSMNTDTEKQPLLHQYDT